MNYERQIEEISKYIKNGEKDKKDFKIGTEIEHFIIDRDTMDTISYYGEKGVESTLKDLIDLKGWIGEEEDGYILSIEKNGVTITLEPGSQFEFNSTPKNSLDGLRDDYFMFLDDVLDILDGKNQDLLNLGYHPKTRIDDITILPKKRYDYMFNYFKKKGSHAHNMMKGTAALQMAIDYSSQEDYIKKFKVVNGLSPVIYAMVDNSYYFEGKSYEGHNLRAYIWENTDKDRSGVVPSSFDLDYSYGKYADYILNHPPILMDDGKRVYPTGDKLVRDIFDPEAYSKEELDHILTMVFPDVRTKNYIEIRMMDSVPYPLNFSIIAFLKGILYNEKNLYKVYGEVQKLTYEDIVKSKESIYKDGLKGRLKDRKILDIARELVEISTEGLSEDERHYIEPLRAMIEEGMCPYDITKNKADEGLYKSIEWAIIDKNFRDHKFNR